jgi:predicted 3-demethylubiquinone-9 3-methyltransferase (glyoxalase superfamily)
VLIGCDNKRLTLRLDTFFTKERKAHVQKITTFLMFEGRAEEAMSFYASLFKQSQVLSITRYGPNEPGAEGTVQHATFTLNGQEFMCIDSYVQHDFTFTPAISLYVRCGSEEEIDAVYAQLSAGGQVLMPLDRYPFSRKFGWVADRFGVSWQLSLDAEPGE